ncbi:MAG: hypothetical protein IAF38_06835 [Bacteroidia bacterium]|nr:hypothetical protein [Bacteroidia bacterium]
MNFKKNKIISCILFFFIALNFAFSLGKDSLLKFNSLISVESNTRFFVGDSTKAKAKTGWSIAKKATVLSACFPGLGQIYNKKYWKVPVIYVVMGGLGYSILKNNTNYQRYRKALLYRADGDSTTVDEFNTKYTEDNLVTLKRSYRRYRDLSILGACLIYVIQIIDANVDGHLTNFDVDNISFHVSPWNYNNTASNKKFTGLSLTMKF